MVLYILCSPLCLLFLDFDAKNFLVSFQPKPITIRELLAQEKFPTDGRPPGVDFYDIPVPPTGQVVRIYNSHPIFGISDGELFSLDDLIVKICDFGKGTNL